MPDNELIQILSPLSREQEEPQNFYIWGYQSHFETTLKIAADRLFQELEINANHHSFLVAINIKQDNKYPAAVVEPENAKPCAADFENVIELTKQLEKVKPGTSYCWHEGDEESGKAWANSSLHRDYCVLIRQAVEQTTREYGGETRRVYVSSHRQLGPYLIFSVVTVSQNAFDQYPYLRRTQRDLFSVTTSLIDAACVALLDKCRDAILSSVSGDGFAELPTTSEILRDAATKFMYTPFGACKEMKGLHGGFHTCNEISTLTYEKTIGLGRLILCKDDHAHIHRTIEFANPPELRNFRSTRKLLELASSDEALISNSHVVSGVGNIIKGYDPGNEDLFTVEFVGHAKWRLVHCGVILMIVEYGIPQLPQQHLQLDEFIESYKRIFPNDAEKHSTRIRRIAQTASELNHGTIIIISANVADEAVRFATQATAIEPQPLTVDLLERASRIDGAILISPDSTCHAIGVILDGMAINKGSSARGSRFNSTIRYVYGRPPNSTLGVVISDDGMVDVIPEYRPVIAKRSLRDKIDQLSKLAESEKFDNKAFVDTMEWLQKHCFYLSTEQCDEINSIRDKYSEMTDIGGGVRYIFSDLHATSEMDDSYFSD